MRVSGKLSENISACIYDGHDTRNLVQIRHMHAGIRARAHTWLQNASTFVHVRNRMRIYSISTTASMQKRNIISQVCVHADGEYQYSQEYSPRRQQRSYSGHILARSVIVSTGASKYRNNRCMQMKVLDLLLIKIYDRLLKKCVCVCVCVATRKKWFIINWIIKQID